MAEIEIYSDETKCNKNTFKIYVMVWGEKLHCSSFKNDIINIIDDNRKILGKDFKNFHSYKLGIKNCNSTGPVYKQVLNLLKNSIVEKRLQMLLRIESTAMYERNAGYLKRVAEVNMKKRESEFGRIFKSLDDKDLPAFYHRADQLTIFLKYRDKFGLDNDKLYFFPDSVGKILRYEGLKFDVSGKENINHSFNFYDLIKIWGNSLCNIINKDGWPNGGQRLEKFQPLKSDDDYLIQTCDIISNFFFNYLRQQVGIQDEGSLFKADALNDILDLSPHKSQINLAFEKDGDEVVCVDPDLKVCIDVE